MKRYLLFVNVSDFDSVAGARQYVDEHGLPWEGAHVVDTETDDVIDFAGSPPCTPFSPAGEAVRDFANPVRTAIDLRLQGAPHAGWNPLSVVGRDEDIEDIVSMVVAGFSAVLGWTEVNNNHAHNLLTQTVRAAFSPTMRRIRDGLMRFMPYLDHDAAREANFTHPCGGDSLATDGAAWSANFPGGQRFRCDHRTIALQRAAEASRRLLADPAVVRTAIGGSRVMVIETSVPTDGTTVRIIIEGDGIEDPIVTVAMQTRPSSAWMSGAWLPLTVTTDPAEAAALIVATTNPLDTDDATSPAIPDACTSDDEDACENPGHDH